MTGYSSGYPSGYPSGGRIGAPAVSGDLGQKWGGSPLSTQWEKTGQIQSVPPWYIFEQNRPEGKVHIIPKEHCFLYCNVHGIYSI